MEHNEFWFMLAGLVVKEVYQSFIGIRRQTFDVSNENNSQIKILQFAVAAQGEMIKALNDKMTGLKVAMSGVDDRGPKKG